MGIVALLARRRLILAIAFLLALTGVASWLLMGRREDPAMPAFWGQVVVRFPGADAEKVERLVVEPIEDALAEVEAIATVHSTAYAEAAVIAIDLDEGARDTAAAWDDVREALAAARAELPDGAGEPALNDEMSTDHDAVVLAIVGSGDPAALLAAARTLRHALLGVREVARVRIIGDPGEQVTVELDDTAARRLGLAAEEVAAQLAARTHTLAGGTLAVGDRTVRLRPLAELESVEEVRATPLRLPSGATVPLAEMARVRSGPREPAGERMRLDGVAAVGLGVVAKIDADAVRFGDAVRRRVADVAPRLAPLRVETVAFQPEWVARRLSQLNQALLGSVLMVAGLLVLAMGLRLGLVVASVVPLVTFSSLALFAGGGGVLHQISIAALVLAIGMLVDNAIVIAENVQWRLDRGESAREAAVGAVRELAVPLAGATATTVAAFVPMLLAQSSTGHFTRSIPVLLILTLSMSFVFALLVTPVLSQRFLVPGTSRATRFTAELGRRLAALAVGRTRLVLVIAALLVTGATLAAGLVKRQFFPAADRNQLVVDLALPEGAHLDATDAAAAVLERALAAREEVAHVASFVGRGAPRFYYNIQSVPWSPHAAQLVVTTPRPTAVEPLLAWLRDASRTLLPGVEVVGRRLEQGPPVGAPVEVRLFGDDLAALQSAAVAVGAALRETPGAADVRHDLGPGEPTLRFVIDDAAAARHALSRADVARALYGHTRGLPAGELRSGEDPVPIVVRTAAGERLGVDSLDGLAVTAPGRAPVPLALLARPETAWRPAAIHHRDRSRVVTVSSQLAAGATYSDVTRALAPRLAALGSPIGVRMGFGGDVEGSGDANAAMLRTVPIGLLLLIGVLLAEFNSFRRVALVFVTVPLAVTGVVPGLLLAGQPFGFMSLLGVFALVGVVVNNAIVLLEVVEERRRQGATIDEALADAIERRVRPILLTAGTTVVGMLPLALSPSTLWPPLAWAIISGLTASTLLTLVVVPALYRVVFGAARRAECAFERVLPRAAAFLGALLVAGHALAEEPERLTLAEAMQRGMERPRAEVGALEADAVAAAGLAERRLAYLPTVGAAVTAQDRDRELALLTPIGSFPFGRSRTDTAGIELRQPLLDPARLLHTAPATRAEERAARLAAARDRQQLAVAAAEAYLDVLGLDARRRSTIAYRDALRARLVETAARVAEGRALEADALKLRLAVDRAELDELTLAELREVALAALARAVGASGVVEPAGIPSATELYAWTDGAGGEHSPRPDLDALAAAHDAAEHRRAAVRAEALPRLDARAAWSWTSGSPYDQDHWLDASVSLTWTPLAAGTRAARAAALAARREAIARELAEAESGRAVEMRAARAQLVTARATVVVGERGIAQASEALRVERQRHAAGRATTNDLLDAEAALREQTTRHDVARLDVARAAVRLWLADGTHSLSSLFE